MDLIKEEFNNESMHDMVEKTRQENNMAKIIQDIKETQHDIENCYKELKLLISNNIILETILKSNTRLENIILELTKLRDGINNKL